MDKQPVERVLQAPPPDVGNGEGKRGGPNARREAALACSFSLLPTDTPGLRGSVLPLRLGSSPQLGKSPGEENDPLQYSFLENSMDRGTWQPIVHGVSKSWT